MACHAALTMIFQERNFLLVLLCIHFPPLSLPLFNRFTLQLPFSHLLTVVRIGMFEVTQSLKHQTHTVTSQLASCNISHNAKPDQYAHH